MVKVDGDILSYQDYTPELDNGVWIAKGAMIIGDVKIGKDCGIWFGAIVRGDVHRVEIGDRTNIQDLSMVHVTHHKGKDRVDSDGNPTIIGSDVTVGHRVMLHGCIIEDGSLIGMSATILDGAVIGKNSIVGAGSLVTKNKIFPPKSLIMGTPARVIRELSDDEVAELYASAERYVKFKENYE